MSVTLRADNYSSLNILDSSRLTESTAAGSATISVENPNEFDAGALVLFGQHTDHSEIKAITSKAGNIITLSAPLTLDHARYEDVHILLGDQIRFYRASNGDNTPPSDGSFGSLAIVSIDTDENNTSYTDATGSSDYWYKYTYRNSITSTETDIADALAVRGGGVGNYTTVDAIRSRAGFNNNQNITNGTIYRYQLSAQAEIDGALSGRYQVPFEKPINATIRDITELIAAGSLAYDQFRSTAPSAAQEGKDMADDGRAKLQRIVDGGIVLLNVTGVPTNTVAGSLSVSGYPNTLSGESLFSMDKGF